MGMCIRIKELRNREDNPSSGKGWTTSRLLRIVCLSVAFFLLSAVNHPITAGGEVEGSLRITVDELKGMLGNPDLVILDVRDPIGWSKGDKKILGAVREDPENFSAWAGKYPKGKMIVLYCS